MGQQLRKRVKRAALRRRNKRLKAAAKKNKPATKPAAPAV
jgi:hypothetical protein